MRDEELVVDPACARCDAPLVDTRSAVVRDAETYCCVNCARAVGVDVVRVAGGHACSRCGAPISDRSGSVAEGANVFCCPNCSAAGVNAEPIAGG